ncbi:MAG: O-antigen ligase family protein [Candidatus Paraimprobicoccus trichonymphae]|uniref:O-antigen ligase family protein n=1 Tax=Candidatus Paraimprobicoccus trichonymphae TaxID=3033793 RepID=A0AA48IBG4_9FIRM|nr:MAG: O-antigen ligase family protein [Candidatus Paraimprobicoccus trichonymphae]
MNLNKILDLSIFRILYLVSLSLEMIAIVCDFASIFKVLILSFGLFVFVYNYIIKFKLLKIKFNFLILGFIFVSILTSFWNMSEDFLANLVFVYHFCLCFFIFFGMYLEKNGEKLKLEFLIVLCYLVGFATIFSIISLIISVPQFNIILKNHHTGIVNNRLVGIFTNANLLAFSMVISIVSCDILQDSYMKNKFYFLKKLDIFFILIKIINIFEIFLSDSNDAFLFVVLYFIIKISYNIFSKYEKFSISRLIKGSLILVIASSALFSVCFVFRNMCQNIIKDYLYKYVYSNINLNNSNILNNNEDMKLGRENYDISSGRVTLMLQGIELFKINKYIGIGRANLVNYGNKYLTPKLIFSDLHNSYLTILVSYGILGFTIFIIFSVLVAVDLCKSLFQSNSSIFVKLFSLVFSYCIYAIFEKGILSEISFIVVVFWYFLGVTCYKVYYKPIK